MKSESAAAPFNVVWTKKLQSPGVHALPPPLMNAVAVVNAPVFQMDTTGLGSGFVMTQPGMRPGMVIRY